MQITLNGKPCEAKAENLAELLLEQGVSDKVATAVNERFVPATARSACKLEDGDRVEILGAMQGG